MVNAMNPVAYYFYKCLCVNRRLATRTLTASTYMYASNMEVDRIYERESVTNMEQWRESESVTYMEQ